MRLYKTREAALAGLERVRQRGADLANAVVSLGDGKYATPSTSEPGKTWIVDMHREVCGCPSYRELNQFQDHKRPPIRCKHIWSVVYWKQRGGVV